MTLNYPGIQIIHIRINQDPPVHWFLLNSNVSFPADYFQFWTITNDFQVAC